MEPTCECRIKRRTQEERTRLIHRLNRIEGQVRGIRTMVENDVYCSDILIQSSAVRAALSAFERELLSEHIRTCVRDRLQEGDETVVDELVETLRRMMK